MKTIGDILAKKGSELVKLINKTRAAQDLETIFRTALDGNLAKQCHLANYQDSELTVMVSNPSWATRLRYAIPDIIKHLQVQPEFKNLIRIRYTIEATRKPPTKAKNPRPKLSPENEILWQKTLEALQDKTGKKSNAKYRKKNQSLSRRHHEQGAFCLAW